MQSLRFWNDFLHRVHLAIHRCKRCYTRILSSLMSHPLTDSCFLPPSPTFFFFFQFVSFPPLLCDFHPHFSPPFPPLYLFFALSFLQAPNQLLTQSFSIFQIPSLPILFPPSLSKQLLHSTSHLHPFFPLWSLLLQYIHPAALNPSPPGTQSPAAFHSGRLIRLCLFEMQGQSN